MKKLTEEDLQKLRELQKPFKKQSLWVRKLKTLMANTTQYFKDKKDHWYNYMIKGKKPKGNHVIPSQFLKSKRIGDKPTRYADTDIPIEDED